MNHTIDNPKLVEDCCVFKDRRNFTGVVKDKDGTVVYYLNGKWHREDGPAVIGHDGSKGWYLNDKFYGDNDDFTNESWIRFIKLELLK